MKNGNPARSYYYRVYGHILKANIRIPGLGAEEVDCTPGDIAIHMGEFPKEIQQLITLPSAQYYVEPGYAEGTTPELVVNRLEGSGLEGRGLNGGELNSGSYFHFNYRYGAEFVMDQDATMTWGRWKPPLVLEDASLYLLGPVIGFMLRLRNITCLHASGIVIDGKALALTGPSGAGKSTLAASFATAGYPILTDDVLPLIEQSRVIHAQPGYSRLRLFSHSFEHSPDLPDNLPLLAPGWNKHYLDLAEGSYQRYPHSAVLQLVYIIDWSTNKCTSPVITDLPGAVAVPLLAANTYRNELLGAAMRAREFDFLGHLSRSIKVKKLCPVDDISAIPQLRDLLLEDFHKESARQEETAQSTLVGAPLAREAPGESR